MNRIWWFMIQESVGLKDLKGFESFGIKIHV